MYRTPRCYRPIALLPIIRKVIEALIVKRVTKAAEAYNPTNRGWTGGRTDYSRALDYRSL
jgi:hypothetical protein